MRLSWQTDFALRTLLYLGSRSGRATIAEVADFYHVSKDHLAKVVQRLCKLGYLRSVRGAGGGVELAVPPEEIRLGPAIEAFEGRLHLLDCVVADGVCVIQPGCKLRHVLAEAERIQTEYLNGITLADVMDRDRDLATWTIF